MTITFPTTAGALVVYLIGLIILWAIVSIPVYFAGKVVKGGEASFGMAMGATLGGGIAYYLVYFGVGYFLGAVIGNSAYALGALLAILVWLAVYRSAFRTGWLGAIGIALVAWIILLILDLILVAAFGVKVPNFYPF